MSDALGILVLGCIYGATTCSVACLPMMAPYLLLAPNGFKEGAVASLSYLAGKALMYACWGALWQALQGNRCYSETGLGCA